MQSYSFLPTVTASFPLVASSSVLNATSVVERSNTKSPIICRWVPSGKSYPKLIAQWVIVESDSNC